MSGMHRMQNTFNQIKDQAALKQNRKVNAIADIQIRFTGNLILIENA